MDAALWLVNKEQANLQLEKVAADQTLEVLQNLEKLSIANKNVNDHMTIGEVAAFTGVTASAK